MRSQAEARLCLIPAAVLFAALAVGTVAGHRDSAQAGAGRPAHAEIARAIEKVKADPNLATERTIKMLRWKDATETKPTGMPGWLKWIAGLFRWLDQSARLLMWGAAIVLAALLAVYGIRMMRKHGLSSAQQPFIAPTHVFDLDIRPESLPEDIGMAARALWDRGERRASLALLYRGMLSRLAHVHRLPIRDSSTEGDCLALVATHLTPERSEYASRLVRVWQLFVYGAQDTQAATVYVLCDDFASALGPASPLDSMGPGVPA